LTDEQVLFLSDIFLTGYRRTSATLACERVESAQRKMVLNIMAALNTPLAMSPETANDHAALRKCGPAG
jgi:hypothetical protein